ncbi:hypothetical protein P4H66_20975 [Paenibacillus dokdonensis]|uniref:Uncharacterized protein n=1 Tax=Paenibacillus dokdonensis TaxID=2567944 RepID=A0ABU6GRE4_9BACL|nr:hypothetical protein [Paenibacillus dokdonensis]MEC0242283.1 hypothetical protein [Paenibacillus dokdonensis]
MLEQYTFEKLLEYDQADRKNAEKIKREQEIRLIHQSSRENNIYEKWYEIPLRLFRRSFRRQRYRA